MNKKILVLVGGILGVVLLLGGVAFLATGGFSHPLLLSISVGNAQAAAPVPVAQPAVAEAAEPEPVVASEVPGIMVDLGAKVVNLADPGGYRYVRAGIVLEIAPPLSYLALKGEEEKTTEAQVIRDEIIADRAAIDDVIVTLLSSKAFGDVFTMDGKERLKAELLEGMNDRLESYEATRIYFTDFIIQ